MKKNEGFTFIEIMVSMVVLGIGLVGLAGLTNVIIFHNMYAADYHTATRLAYDKMNELLRYDSEYDVSDSNPESKYCTTAGGSNCSSGITSGWMLASSPAYITLNPIQSTFTTLDNPSIGPGVIDGSDNKCRGIPNTDRLEDGTASDQYCMRLEYDLNSEGNYLRKAEGGVGKNSLGRQPPYKYNRYYLVCRCLYSDPTGGSEPTMCDTPCSYYPHVGSGKITFTFRVFVYWLDSRGKYHYVSTPFQGTTMEVDNQGQWQ